MVPIFPVKSEESFENIYKLKLSEFAQLIKDEKVIPILAGYLEEYNDWINNFFEDIELKEQKHIPATLRLSFILASLKHGEEWSFFSRKVSEDVRKFKDSLNSKLQEILSTFEIKGEVYEYLTNDISNLRLLGLDQIANAILSFDSIDDALRCACFSSLFTNPIFISLGGYTNRNREYFIELQKFFERLVPYAHPTSFITCGRALLMEFKRPINYSYPENFPPLEYVKIIEEIDGVEENFEAFVELQKCLNRVDIQGAYNIVEKAREITDKITLEIASEIPRNYNYANYSFTLSFIPMNPIAALKLADILSNNLPLSFPLYASTEVGKIKEDLQGLARWLIWVIPEWFISPYIIWEKIQKDF